MQRSFLNRVHRKVRRLLGHKAPPQLWIAVTYNCQCRCGHCAVGPELNKKTNELNRTEITSILEEASFLGFRRVAFFGGEPLLRPDLPDIIKDTSKSGLLSTIYTNGILLNREYVHRLKEAGLDKCNISMDSPDSNVHDKFRHYEGCFERAIEGIRNLKEVNISTSIWTHVSKQDVSRNELKDLKRLIQMGRELNVSSIMILFPMATGNWLCGWNEILTREEREQVRKLLEPPFVGMEFPDEMATCRGGRMFVYIKPDGSVTPCPSIASIFGNIRQESLRSILRRIEKDFCCIAAEHQGDCVFNNPYLREKINLSSVRR